MTPLIALGDTAESEERTQWIPAGTQATSGASAGVQNVRWHPFGMACFLEIGRRYWAAEELIRLALV
jgi:hypothetical protein